MSMCADPGTAVIATTGAGPDRVQAMLALIERELRARQQYLNEDRALCSVNLTVRFNSRTGAPFRLLFRPEAEIDLA